MHFYEFFYVQMSKICNNISIIIKIETNNIIKGNRILWQENNYPLIISIY